jgi:hypothetical protein
MMYEAERLWASLELPAGCEALVFKPWELTDEPSPRRLRATYLALKASWVELGYPPVMRVAVVDAAIAYEDALVRWSELAKALAKVAARKGYWLEAPLGAQAWRLLRLN